METKLIERILVRALNPNKILGNFHSDLFLNDSLEDQPDLVYIYPESGLHPLFEKSISNMFSTHTVKLESERIPPYFFTNVFDERTRYHCLIIHEKVSPLLMEKSKGRRCPKGLLSLLGEPVGSPVEELGDLYAPVAICLETKTNHIDLFRDILQNLYLYLISLSENPIKATSEFFRYAEFLVNEIHLPRFDVHSAITIGSRQVSIPVDRLDRIPPNESCVSILLELIDIRYIIIFWESALLNKHSFLISCNDYLLFLMLEAFKMLMFPLDWAVEYVPVVGTHLLGMIDYPVPVLLGVNSSAITIEKAKQLVPDATVLDIDSNALYLGQPHMLCDCVNKRLSKKLQVAKAYYYVDQERLATFQIKSLERSVQDHVFVEKVHRLESITDAFAKEQAFICCIRDAFFYELRSTLWNYADFLSYKALIKRFEFQKDLFIEQISCCSLGKMKKWWNSFFENSLNFVDFWNKNPDEDNFRKRFDNILAIGGEYKVDYDFRPPEAFIKNHGKPREILRKINEESVQEFFRESVDRIHEKIKDSLDTAYLDHGSIGNIELLNSLMDSPCTNIFYGKYGIIRLKLFFS